MFSRIHTEDIHVAKLFASECKECLEGLEKEIAELEVRQDDICLIDHISGKIRRIKRASSFTGLPGITLMSHETELILDAVKDRRITAGKETIDSLLLYSDFINAYVTELHDKLTKHDFSCDSGLTYLEFESPHNEMAVIDSLKQAYENRGGGEEESSKLPVTLPEGEDLFILQSEEFRKGLSEGIREQFLLESTEHIERIENDLLIRLDTNNGDREAINEIFRAVHSIKGGAGIYLAALPAKSPEYSYLKDFAEVVHTYESLLALVRDKGCGFDNKLVDLSLAVMDYLKSSIRSAASGELRDLQNSSVLDGISRQISRIRSESGGILQKPASASPQEPAGTDDSRFRSSLTQSIRVSQEKIDKMMNMVSELLVAKNSFMHISAKLSMEYDLPEISREVKEVGAYINRISDELQNAVMSVRMVEIRTVFQKMPRVVRDIAQSTGKKMELHMEGEDTEIDKTIIEQISDPLVHLIRNAADHGIEAPEERISKGKPETGRIVLRAYNKNKYVYIEIEDDGAGIDAEKMKEKAIEKGFVTRADADRMSRNQLMNLIFLPGFSTARQITEISGRGVGMDIVKSNIAKIKGNIMLDSEVGRGTKFIIQLPLSLAVSRGLAVEASGETYIIPLEHIVETVRINRSSIHRYNGKCFTYLRGEVIRIDWLGRIFMAGGSDTREEELNAVILTNGAENFAIVVDKLKNEQEFVVKTLDGHLASIPGISGSTLLGNGQVVLIVNPADLLQLM
ncbi:MAG TPA: chemotaxis protein CheA [Clostridiales bacterium]|nr:chemotaxis protein CheA [Clostridiales bacterium]HPV01434.1 chemotaxis protein CheA [Clostridiales bacterium]